MQIEIRFSVPEYTAMFRAWKFVKRQLAPILVVGAAMLGVAWFAAGVAAVAIWADYPSNDAGWIIIWLLVTGAWGGLLFYMDAKGK